jgi:hypothetical protein
MLGPYGSADTTSLASNRSFVEVKDGKLLQSIASEKLPITCEEFLEACESGRLSEQTSCNVKNCVSCIGRRAGGSGCGGGSSTSECSTWLSCLRKGLDGHGQKTGDEDLSDGDHDY